MANEMTPKQVLEQLKIDNQIYHDVVCRNKRNLGIIEQALTELNEYKQLEKELGIDLKTLFKALREGIYVRNLGIGNTNWNKEIITKVKVPCIKLDYKEHKILCFEQKRNWWYDQFKFEDYGKTWALTKKELL